MRETLHEFLLTVHDVADFLAISVREVWRREAAGQIPKAIRMGKRIVRWKVTELEAYLRNLGDDPPGDVAK